MQMESNKNEETCSWFNGIVAKIKNVIIVTSKDVIKLGKEDPRRIIHSFKVGLAITLVSLFYYFDFSYEGFGVSAMWAVMTVVVVFEFSVGATLGKGVNRGIATLLGGSLGVGAHRLASFSGEKLECIILGLLVFFIAGVVTFIRFFPKLKARYDYGLMIIILTFSLICVSGYRDDEVLQMACSRLSTILVGGFATVFICVFICPIWAGKDLHSLIATNIESLGIFLEGFEHEYFDTTNDKNQENNASMDGYKTVFNSKATEEALVNFAKWEPRHGKFRYRHPWDQYLKIGALTRECAYKIDALNGFLNSEMQTPMEIRAKIQEPCTKMSLECSYALKDLALGMNIMACSLPVDHHHILNAKVVANKLKLSLKTELWPDSNLLDIIPTATVASLLIEILSCTVKIVDSVNELASISKLERRQTSRDEVTRSPSVESHSLSITVE